MPDNKKPLTDQSNNPLRGLRHAKIISRAQICFAIFGLCLLSSCFMIPSIITETPGFYSGYKRLPAAQKNTIVIIDDKDILPVLIDSNTYAITAKHLIQFVKAKAPCVVYLWDSRCSGSSCISIPAFNQFCQENSYNAVIVSEYFDFEMLAIQSVKPSSVFAINHWHYGTDYCNKYVCRFQQSFFDLFNTEYNAKYPYKYIYYDGKTLTHTKPAWFGKYPWR